MDHPVDKFSPSEVWLEDARPSKRQRTSARPAREVGLMRSIPGDKFPGFVGSASGIFFIRSVYGAIRHSPSAVPTAAETPGSDVVPGEDDHLPLVHPVSAVRLWSNDELTAEPIPDVSFEKLVAWTASYFANWHTFYPFLHAPSILDYFNEFSRAHLSNQDDPGGLQMIILRSIMSISLADHRQSSLLGGMRYPSYLVFESYDAAMDSLLHVLSRPTSILGLQAAVGVQLFLISMLRLNAASRLGGLIIRMAVQLGLHRCPARFASFSTREKELRQRVFWTIYSIDRFICQSMGLPLGLHDDDIDVCYPMVEHHLQTPVQPDSKLCLSQLLAQQVRIRGEIIELRNKSLHYVHKDPNKATTIAAKLTQWWNDVEEYADPDGQHSSSVYSNTVLAILKHESTISLYRPVLAALRKDAEYDAALQHCIGSARSIITTLHQAIQPRAGPGQATDALSLLWPSCTWAVWISTFILFYAANVKQLEQSIVVRLANRSLDILQHLSRRGSAWPEASSAAIRDLLTRMSQQTQHADSGNDMTAHTSEEEVGLAPSSHTQPLGNNDDGPTHTMQHMTNNATRDIEAWPKHADSAATSNLHYDTTVFDVQDNDWDAFMGAINASDGMLGDANGLDPFSGFDIPFWFEQDQHWELLQ